MNAKTISTTSGGGFCLQNGFCFIDSEGNFVNPKSIRIFYYVSEEDGQPNIEIYAEDESDNSIKFLDEQRELTFIYFGFPAIPSGEI